MVKKLTADQWWALWEQLSAERATIEDQRKRKADEWLAAFDNEDHSARVETLYDESKALGRQSDIAGARADVAYAHYLIEQYQLDESDIFDVTD